MAPDITVARLSRASPHARKVVWCLHLVVDGSESFATVHRSGRVLLSDELAMRDDAEAIRQAVRDAVLAQEADGLPYAGGDCGGSERK